MSKEQIIEGALALSEEERELLANRLWLSLEHNSSEDIEKAWMEEAERRLDDFHAGKVKTYDGEEVLKELRLSLSKKNGL
ncbi:MAG: addiction module protein [Candidatus Kapaibacterium sp.]